MKKRLKGKRVALIGAPTDIGAGRRGGSMGPEALRIAGLKAAINRLGFDAEDRGDLTGPVNPGAEPMNGYRHLRQVVAWNEAVRNAVHQALKDGDFPVVMGGDHSLAVGSTAGVSRYCAEAGKPLTVLWLDAHADFNTPASSPTGNIHGMPVSFICGHGPSELAGLGAFTPMLDPSAIVQVGVRSVDAVEKRLVAESGLIVHDMRRIDEYGMRAVMKEALDQVRRRNGHLHVSFDVDFLDPSIAPGVATAVPGGPTYREAQLCMEMIHDCGLMASLDVMELNPVFDDHNKTAELVVELIESLFGEQTLARSSKP
ncbi:MAG: arginase [Rhodospirillales bacterium RIFCSPLOWO2_12_FULL_58_28]|nr:MAG: arginase [Rhodospirillales bacterium RIFCSPLOWO2_02_FULL_58_16]OHC78058.1 MAG: arginase [Rhodospirillales bacterium RIFCSPLOWO2_12_FULL_58_28]